MRQIKKKTADSEDEPEYESQKAWKNCRKKKNETFAYNCSHLKRQLHNERTSLPWKIKKKVTAASRGWIS